MRSNPRALAAPRVLLAGALALTSCSRSAEAPPTPPPADDDRAQHAADDDDAGATAPSSSTLAEFIRTHYDKREVEIPMRDGAALHTVIYAPKNADGSQPIMLKRTPYSTKPYGDGLPETLGPSETLARKKWFFVYQDVRGRFMSDGKFVNMTPHVAEKKKQADIDESSDTYDTVEWLIANVEGHNGNVGQWGISYPGFYAAAGMIDAHPALKAVSPQAPIADWFFDDFHHHGAFFLPHAFNFFSVFGQPRRGKATEWPARFDHGTPDGYAFFSRLGPLRNANERYFKGKIEFWNLLAEHPNYDGFWKARNLLPHLHDVAPAVLTVGGLFDAEDLYGSFAVYQSIEKKNPGIANSLVIGPWRHGGWARTSGRRLGELDFGANTSEYYQTEVEAPFFAHHLAAGPAPELPEALVFETGANRWRSFDAWPPKTTAGVLYVGAEQALSATAPTAARDFEQWVSDPANPVPFTERTVTGMDANYMVDDQRFASRRPDVLTFSTPPLEAATTMAGPLDAVLWVSTDKADADFVVKLIDVFPPDAKMPNEAGDSVAFGDAQIMVRSEIIRARFRDGYESPKPMRKGVATEIRLPLQSVLHTFEPGHRIMIQVQSSWFPMVDRNPQSWVDNIFEATDADFVQANHRLFHDRAHPTRIEFGQL